MSDYINEERSGTTFAILQGFNGNTNTYKLINFNIDDGVIQFRATDENDNIVEIKTSMVNVILFKPCDKKENQNV